jgi:hypothetical protein
MYKVKQIDSDQVKVEMTMDEYILMGELVIDQPYAVEVKKSLWSQIKGLF